MPTHNARKSSRRACARSLFVLALLCGTVFSDLGRSGLAQSEPDVSPATSDGTSIDESPTAADPETIGLGTPSPAMPAQLALAIDALIEGEEGVFGIVVMAADSTVLYSRNSTTPFVAASLYKLILLADIALAVDNGALALDTPIYVAPEYFDAIDGSDAYFDPSYAGYNTSVEEAMLATGAYSSNVAAKALLSLTTPEAVNRTARELGLEQTTFLMYPPDLENWPPVARSDSSADDVELAEELVMSYSTDGQVNLTTPADMCDYFALLLHGQIFNERVSHMILEILWQQVINDRIPALLPEGAETAHKTGNLEFVVHDVGIIYGQFGPLILAAMTEGHPDDERAAQIIQRLALIVYGGSPVPPMPEVDPTHVATSEATASPSI